MNYKQLIEKEIPNLLKECSIANWDGYEAEPISQETANRTIIILKKLEDMNILYPHISPSPDGCISIEWAWHKGDWKISVEEQERYAWTIMIEVGDRVFDEKGDCLYFDSDSRDGISKNNTITNSIYFCFENEIPEKAVERIKELEKWISKQLQKCLACGIEKDMNVLERYPYENDCIITDEPVSPLFELDCQSNTDLTDFRRVTICHNCFHKVQPDMWMGQGEWESLNPITHFNNLPKLPGNTFVV